MSSHSTTKAAPDKAAVLKAARAYKAKEHLPLTVHPSSTWGRWCKKVGTKQHHFGPIIPEAKDFGAGAALEEYHRTIADLKAGRVPRPKDEEVLRLKDAINVFLAAKEAKVETGELAARSFANYHKTCTRVADVLGRQRAVIDLQPEDFRKLRVALAKGRGVVSLANDIRHTRILFKFAYDEGLIDQPVRYGQAFDPPSKRSFRVARAEKGARMFEREELLRIIEAAGQPLKAMVLLGANCGFGQTDVSRLTKATIDLRGGWVNLHRHKTGTPRRCPLWPETVQALREAIAMRPEPAAGIDAKLIFLTPAGLPVVRSQQSRKKANAAEKKGKEPSAADVVQIDTVGSAMGALLKKLGINAGRNFYALRHGFETVAGDTADQVAVNAIMGHVDASMAGQYRERIDDARLRRVVNHVRAWLYGTETIG